MIVQLNDISSNVVNTANIKRVCRGNSFSWLSLYDLKIDGDIILSYNTEEARERDFGMLIEAMKG